jgi:predicted anti-sigma-YlaC factor YlaD
MNRLPFGVSDCERTRKYLDSYISNELLVETNHEVLRHLESCRECSAEAEARAALRSRLKHAARAESMPVELPAKIREAIRSAESRKASAWMAWRWPAVGAATLAFAAVAWVGFLPEKLPAIGDRPAQNAYIQKISSRMAAVLKVGLGDHVHCAFFRKKEKTAPSVSEMEKELGPSYQGLLSVVTAAIPDGYRVVMAHHCGYQNRQYIHLTLENGGELLSVVITRKEDGESFAGIAPASIQGGIPVYQSAAGRFQVAGFEAGQFFAYIVSDMSGGANLQVASVLAPAVRDLLVKTRA